MQILVNTDSHIQGSATLNQEVEATVEQALGRFAERITFIEVHLSDQNSSQKSGDADKRCSIQARLGGLQPITVSHQASTVDQAIGGAVDKLEKTLKRTVRRKDSLFKRRSRERATFVAAGPMLNQDVETGKQEEFARVLRPLIHSLGQHARRELRILEANESLYSGQVVFEDLLDDVIARAWLQFRNRPKAMALDLWLTRLLDELLEEKIQRNQPVPGSPRSQSKVARPRTVPQVGEQEWWVWLLGEGDAASGDGEIPSGRSAWAEEYLEAEELLHRIHTLLGELPRVQRQAFVLSVLEAYSPVEIAMVQDRPEVEVLSDIDAARDHLRVRLDAGADPQATAEEADDALADRSGAT